MRTSSLLPGIVITMAADLRDRWNAGDRDVARNALQHADRDVLRWLLVCGSTAPELRLLIRQEEDRRSYAD